jgi:hypothetical protein
LWQFVHAWPAVHAIAAAVKFGPLWQLVPLHVAPFQPNVTDDPLYKAFVPLCTTFFTRFTCNPPDNLIVDPPAFTVS